MRLLGLILLIFLILLASFLVLGGYRIFRPEGVLEFFHHYAAWSIPIGFGLMIADLLLPIPSSAVMNWFGLVYGTLLGGLIGTAACVVSSLVAYWACRWFGHRAAARIAGTEELERVRNFFARWGALAVVAARPVPMLAEATLCLAGMSRMPFGRFLLASLVGSLPFAFSFAWLGQVGRSVEEPLFFMALSFFIPMVLWIPIGLYFQMRRRT